MDDEADSIVVADAANDWTRRLNIRHFQLLLSLAEFGSLSDTARATSTSQPALSKWLKELEESVGSPLFERLPRGLKPTGRGEILLGHARRVLNEMGRAQSSLAAFHDGVAQRVIVGITPPTGASVVPAAVMDFVVQHPKAKVDLWESSMELLLDKLSDGAVDIVVGGLEDYRPRNDVRSEMLYPESMQIVARAKHPLARRQRSLEWDDLYQHDWVVWPLGTTIRHKLDLALTQAGRGPLPYRVQSSSMTANFALLENSDMLSAVSSRLSQYFIRRGGIVALPFVIHSDSSVGMYWRDAEHAEPAVTAMLQSLRKVCREQLS